MNTVTHSYDTSTVLPHLLLDKDRHTCGRRFQISKIFLASSFAKFHIQTSGCTEYFKQVHRQSLLLDSDQIPLNFLLHFFFDILKFVPINSCAVVQKLNKLHEQEFFWFGKDCQSASDKLHAALYNFTATCSSPIQWISDLFYTHCTHQITVCSLPCNELEVSERKF